MRVFSALLVCAACVTWVLVLVSCASPRIKDFGQRLPPISVPEGQSEDVAFTRLASQVSAGTPIGAHYEGFAQRREQRYFWQQNFSVGSTEFATVAHDELRKTGYNVIGASDSLFAVDEPAKARYQLGGKITGIAYNTFGHNAGNFAEIQLKIEWQLFDSVDRQVEFAATTSGYAKGGLGAPVAYEAFSIALRNLLADSNFSATLRKSGTQQVGRQQVASVITPMQRCALSADTVLPRDLTQVLDAVVRVSVGEVRGSGVVISPDGYVVTAAHVVSGVTRCLCTLHSGLVLEAEVLIVDDQQDVALIRLPGRGHTCAVLDTHSRADIGVEVFAIGNPLGYESTVTKGVVSAVRTIDGTAFVQTDASVSHGSSGGPVLTSDGKVVGIVS